MAEKGCAAQVNLGERSGLRLLADRYDQDVESLQQVPLNVPYSVSSVSPDLYFSETSAQQVLHLILHLLPGLVSSLSLKTCTTC